jgi:predicted Zn-dependent protease
MKNLLFAMLITLPGLAGAQDLLEFRNDLAFEAAEVEALAERSYRRRLAALAADHRLDVDTQLLARLRGLMARLQVAAEFERPAARTLAWEIHTCRRCGENAAAMAGGRLLIGEEFISGLALADDEIAYVLAHEMAHVLAEHTREYATTARFFVGNGPNRKYWDIQRELDESLGLNLRMAPVYAQQELEADYMGFILGARSGFDPAAMTRMLHKLHREGGAGFVPHAGSGERMRRAGAMLESAQRLFAMGMLTP